MTQPTPHCPPPWDLTGWGLICSWFSASACEAARATLTAEQQAGYVGGPVVLMLVRYARSDCGPYDELLFIPGRLRGPRGARPLISRIWVSSQASVDNGRRNWAIPKQLAQFEFSDEADGYSACRITAAGLQAQIDFRRRGVGLPVTTSLLSAGMRTLRQPVLSEQGRAEAWCETTVSASARTRLATCRQLRLSGEQLPRDLGRPKLSLLSDNVRMRFPEPRFSDT